MYTFPALTPFVLRHFFSLPSRIQFTSAATRSQNVSAALTLYFSPPFLYSWALLCTLTIEY
ncbi:uncharacterized protein LACBIDRAFT_298963 [Laccaria bicolor S238N-H82]|uniref:Predicted protein n=1 Tax=Laccaria bicolor (strain S238N-H82 / ATCC MYA-4686) TaxID=486041 RepID=B0DDQ1_LACBS|nr:uncharacterized protein LACBIDRAFT_298963 [Laccaria bicolor S238N-H82]EDR07131.1 predicted protein [Laccaria bicolor S238N-H82]|eukprot:XP_001882062.1 predicted protein [Laccaria bicolor S238N-H82]